MNPFKKLAGQTAIYGLPTIVGRLLNYLLVPLYTRIFLPAEYGVVTELYAYVSFLFVILTYGMETSFFRFSTTQSNKDSVYSTAVISLSVTSLIFLLSIFLLSNQLSALLGYEQNVEYLYWFGLILVSDVLSTIPYARLRLENKALKFALVKLTNITVNIAFNLLFLVVIPNVIENTPDSKISHIFNLIYNEKIGVGYIFISNLIASLLTLIMLLPEIIKVRFQLEFNLLKRMISYAWPLLIFGLAGIVNETFDRIILKHLLPQNTDVMSQLGIYGACYKISILMTLFVQTYRYAAEPFFFSHSIDKDAKKTYARLMHYFIIVCFFIFLAITLNIDTVLLFIGEEFREGAGVIPILLAANLFLGVFYNLSIWFKLTDKTKKGALISLIGATITIILNFILIPVMGYMGAAWATFACYAIMMFLSWIYGQKYYPIKYDLKRAGIYALITLTLYLVSVSMENIGNFYSVLINSSLLLLFLAIVFVIEKISLRSKTTT